MHFFISFHTRSCHILRHRLVLAVTHMTATVTLTVTAVTHMRATVTHMTATVTLTVTMVTYMLMITT